jgi:hypothetical protein
MSELVSTRVKEAARRLHLANLEENLDTLVTRAEGATMVCVITELRVL